MMTTQTIIERLNNPEDRKLCPHQMARALTEIRATGDRQELERLREAYIKSICRAYPERSAEEAVDIVDSNMSYAASLADVVAACGYEASGQLRARLRSDGPVSRFFMKTIAEIYINEKCADGYCAPVDMDEN